MIHSYYTFKTPILIIFYIILQHHLLHGSCAEVTSGGITVSSSSATQVNLVQLPPQFTNVTVVNNTNASSLCTPSLQVTDSTVVYDMVTPGNYSNFHDYDVVTRSNRSIFPTWGNELIITPTYSSLLGNSFGGSIALSGDGGTLAIGSAAFLFQSGADTVSLYRRIQNSWVPIQAIQPTFPPSITSPPLISFGASIALSYDGSVLAVGAPGGLLGLQGGNDSTPGAVYLYTYSPHNGIWNLYQTIPGTAVGFGVNVDISATGQYLAICTNTVTFVSGSVAWDSPTVTIYERQPMCTTNQSPWIFQAQLQPIVNGTFYVQNLTANFRKHMALSADGTTIALGCPGIPVIQDVNNTYVFLFQRTVSTWQQTQAIASPSLFNQAFGSSTALSANGKYLAVGLTPSPHVYIYTLRGTTWVSEPTFNTLASLATSLSFSADGTVLVAGASTQNTSSGAFALIVRGPDNRWSTIATFLDINGNQDQLGWSCACSADGSVIAAGAPEANESGVGYAVTLSSIGSTIPNDTVVSGSLCVYQRTTIDSNLKVAGNIHLQGLLVTGTAGHVTACTEPTFSISDKRIKDAITELDSQKALEIIRALQPVHFSFNDSPEAMRKVGFIAQELERLLPGCVKTEMTADGRAIKMVCLHHEVYAYFISALQELQQRVERNREKISKIYEK